MSEFHDLIAPCGMNCQVCSRYQAHLHNFRKSQCRGCRVENRVCAYLLKKCPNPHSAEDGTQATPYCFDCKHFPCREIQRMDTRYRKEYNMSVIDNLHEIQQRGIHEFMADQQLKHACPHCSGLISVHNRKCFECDEVTRLVEKS